ncbi:MAG: hypothetical protein MRZ79_17520 [Bacteroidia bacterium]|nr:hypothetical protein [Bacteroidia bacterium]
MTEASIGYWNELANQLIFLSALLGGFSLAVIVSLLAEKSDTRVHTNLFRAAAFSAASFLISIFAMTKILLMTTKGFPFAGNITGNDLIIPRLVGMITFITGIFSMIAIISLSGWVKSKRMGRFTSILGSIALLLILMMMVEIKL